MPPKAQRSRACNQCRDRRVKCDETPGFCNQCRRLGLTCSGPVVGSIVIDMTERIARPRQRKKKEAARAPLSIRQKSPRDTENIPPSKPVEFELDQKLPTLEVPISHLHALEPKTTRHAADVEEFIALIKYRHQIPSLYQPSNIRPQALDTAFLSHYIKGNDVAPSNSVEMQWLHSIPRLYSEDSKPAVTLSLRALFMAYYAKLHNDPSIMVDSWKWYTRGLNAQRNSLANMKGKEIPTEGEVMVPSIISLYETHVGRNKAGAVSHMHAVGKVIYMRGPANCKVGAIWPLFKGIRNLDAARCLMRITPSAYSSEAWLTIPFVDMPQDAHTALITIELMMPRYMQMLQVKTSFRDFFATPIPPHVDVEPCRQGVSKLGAMLGEWAETYPEFVQRALHGSQDSMKQSSTARQNTFVDIIANLYMTLRLILAGLMYKITTEAPESASNITPYLPASAYREETSICANAILAGVTRVAKSQAPPFDILRCAMPLFTVVCIAPQESQMRQGKELLRKLSTQTGGLPALLYGDLLAS